MMARAATKPKPNKPASETPPAEGEGEPSSWYKADPPDPDTRKRAVRVRASALLAALKDVADVVQGKNTIPVLDHVRFVAGDGRIVLTATDLDIWATRDLATDDRDGPGAKDWIKSIRGFAITLPAKPLKALLGEIDPDAMVTITAPDDLTETYAGQATIQAGRARFRLHCLPSAEFPTLPPATGTVAAFELPCSALADAFAAVEHAISSEETRYYLNGIYLHPAGLDLRMATTDGHRLARLTIDAPDGAASFPAAIVGRRTVALLDKLLQSAAKAAGDSAAPPRVLVEASGETLGGLVRWSMPGADGSEVMILAKTIDGSFPDYERVIPSDPAHRAVLVRADLAEAVKRVAVLSPRESRIVRATFTTDKLELRVSSADLGEATEELPCDYAGPDAVIGFNSQFWRDALGALASETVAMSFDEDGRAPVLVHGVEGGSDCEKLVQVLMPMRV